MSGSCIVLLQLLQMKGVPGVTLHLWIVPPLSVASSNTDSTPKCRYVNLEVYPGSKIHRSNFKSSLFLENPYGRNYLTYDTLQSEVILTSYCRDYPLLLLFIRPTHCLL